MRRFSFVSIAMASLAGLLGLGVFLFKRNPRMGSNYVNSVVNPFLLRRGLVGSGRAEIGTLEHFGRSSGRRYLTPIHPTPTPEGFQVIVPLGEHSEWARNVLAAGHCRLQLHDVVFELDEPVMHRPTDLPGAPALVRRAEDYLGFEYLTLRTFSSAPGTLEEPVERTAEVVPQPEEAESVEAPLAV